MTAPAVAPAWDRLKRHFVMPATTGRVAVSDIALIASNAIPLFGVLVLHWQVFPIILIYWCENVVIGAFNVLKMIIAMPQEPALWVAKIFLVPFFCLHYGMFTRIHGIFVFTMFGGPAFAHQTSLIPYSAVQAIRETGTAQSIAALICSHAVSFVWNFLARGEFRRISPAALMVQPYSRVLVLHFTLIIGGMAAMAIGAPVGALVVLIAIKTAVDLAAHRRERMKFAGGAAAGGLFRPVAASGQSFP